MCGRFTLIQVEKIPERFDAKIFGEVNLRKRYNISPGQPVPLVFQESPNKIEEMIWGLIPHWASDPSTSKALINARSDSLLEKPAFKESFLKRRCLVPADGFYEWKLAGKEKIPHYIRMKDSSLFAFAGLYDIWKDKDGKVIKTFTIITTEPNSLLKNIHNRMPVILREEDEKIWVNKEEKDVDKLLSILKPYPPELMEAYPVSKKVNSNNNDSEDLIKPIKIFYLPNQENLL
ncbi:MAG TPA: SOS response-associated peptidase [Dictyoglomaceae bacterium]|nr:SOS response-associated peptidase [Dictyoglomaceae bacterium]